MAERVEYKVIENPPNFGACEMVLNELAEEGWKVVGFSQYQICLERIKSGREKELLTEDMG